MSATLGTGEPKAPTLKASYHPRVVFATFGDGNFAALPRSDARYAILFVIFDDKQHATLNSPCISRASIQ